MSGTHLYYNGVLMRDCELLEFAQVIEYDESGTDPLFSRVRITVASTLVSLHSTAAQAEDEDPEDDEPVPPVIGPSSLDAHPSTIAIQNVDGESMVDRYQFIQKRLQVPRKDFWFALHAVTNKPLEDNEPNANTPAKDSMQNDSYRVVLAAAGIDNFAPVNNVAGSPTKGGRLVEGYVSGVAENNTQILRNDVVDANNGPKPQSVNVQKINGGRAMRVHFSIEVCRALCESNDTDPSIHPIRNAQKVVGVLSNRWSISETLNEKWEAEIVVEGTLIVSDHRFKPDAMRLMTSCALFPYAKLVSRHFSQSTDGLKLKYRYTLREAGIAPPPGTVDWEGKYTERVQNGGHVLGSLSVKVRGTHRIPSNIVDFDGQPIVNQQRYKQFLTDWVFFIIQSRFNVAANFNPNPGVAGDTIVPVDLVVVENMKEPEIEANVTVRHSSDDLSRGFAMRLHNFGKGFYDAGNPLLADYSEKAWPIPPAFTWEPSFFDSEKGSAYDCYFQTPCNEWHGKPEGWNREFAASKRLEEAEAATVAYLYRGGDELAPGIPAAIPSPTFFSTYGWSDEHLGSGFTYLSVEIDNHYENNTGVLALPLSKPRISPTTGFNETVAFFGVHAGMQCRTFTMIAIRQGAWPKVPAPRDTITNSSRGYSERLMKAEVLPSAPRIGTDGRSKEYSVQVKWTYIRSRPIGGNPSDVFGASSDPRDKTSPGGNELPIAYFYDYSGAIDA